jgi:branched-chain amino acid aminotransferase
MVEELASINGQIGPIEQARVPVTDDGLLRGDGVFEVMRLYAGRPFAVTEHFERLAGSASNLRLELDADLVRSEMEALLAAGGSRDGCVRIVVTRGGNRIIMTEPLPEIGASVSLASVTYQPTVVLDGVKSLSYAANMLAGRIARERGADEALLVTTDGHVLEAPTSTFFWVEGSNVFTPPLTDSILESITRRYVISITAAQERTIELSEMLELADEAFLASTTREVQRINSIDERKFESSGTVTTELAIKLHEFVDQALKAT